PAAAALATGLRPTLGRRGLLGGLPARPAALRLAAAALCLAALCLAALCLAALCLATCRLLGCGCRRGRGAAGGLVGAAGLGLCGGGLRRGRGLGARGPRRLVVRRLGALRGLGCRG